LNSSPRSVAFAASPGHGETPTLGGFSLRASTTVSATDAAGKEALYKYILRPPIAAECVQLLGDERVRLVLKRPFAAASASPCRRTCSTRPERARVGARIRPEAAGSCGDDVRTARCRDGAPSSELDRGVDCPDEAGGVTWENQEQRAEVVHLSYALAAFSSSTRHGAGW